jgi:hypothetical protein
LERAKIFEFQRAIDACLVDNYAWRLMGRPDGKQFRISPGMLGAAEVNLGMCAVMEYLLSPVQKVTHKAAAREVGPWRKFAD